jgi:hypothetical protein
MWDKLRKFLEPMDVKVARMLFITTLKSIAGRPWPARVILPGAGTKFVVFFQLFTLA